MVRQKGASCTFLGRVAPAPIISAFFLLVHHAAGACTATTSSPDAPDRIVSLSLDCQDTCADQQCWFKLSEGSDFAESGLGRVKIDIDAVAPDSSYADVSITYPDGTPGGNGRPFHVQPATKTLRVLAVMYAFEDSETLEVSGMPSYATDAWLRNVAFGTTSGFDGQPTANSIKAHIEQNTYGRVVIGGDTYPTTIRLPLQEFFDPLDVYPTRRHTVEALLDYIAQEEPSFFSERAPFDFLIGFTPDRYNVEGGLEGLSFNSELPGYSSHPSVRGYITSQMPITANSYLYDEVADEERVSHDATTVSTKYDPNYYTNIEVRLASDTDHTGINYYTGGEVMPYNTARSRRYFRLGTPLPANETAVLVTYTPSTTHYIKTSVEDCFPDDTLIYDDRWYSRYMHELYHGISQFISFNGRKMGDLYKRPGRLERYDIMDNGFISTRANFLEKFGVGTCVSNTDRTYYEASQLSGYSKMASEFVFPYEVKYGEDEVQIRLYKSEENDFTDTDQRTKLIRVPLRPEGDPGFHRMMGITSNKQYAGSEFLLLEWRYRGPLETGANGFNGRNTDKYLPSEGLMVTHVVHDPSYRGTGSTGFGGNIVQILDATPPPGREEAFTDNSQHPLSSSYDWITSPALFGPESNVWSLNVPALWQQMDDGDPLTDAEFLLSEGSGDKTVYVKFKNETGGALDTTAVSFTLSDASTAADRIPSMTIVAPAANDVVGVITNTTRVTISNDAPNGVVRTFWIYDGVPKSDSSGDKTTDFLRTGHPNTEDQWPEDGFHVAKYVAIDRAGISFETSLPFYKRDVLPSSNTPPVANAGPDRTVSVLSGNTEATVVVDGRTSTDSDGVIMSYEWLESGQVVSNDPLFPSRLSPGVYALTLRVADNWGAQDNATVAITVNGLEPTTAPSSKPSRSPSLPPTSFPSSAPSQVPTPAPGPVMVTKYICHRNEGGAQGLCPDVESDCTIGQSCGNGNKECWEVQCEQAGPVTPSPMGPPVSSPACGIRNDPCGPGHPECCSGNCRGNGKCS